MAITLNSTVIAQPTELQEDYNQIQHDNTAVDGSQQRNRIGQKKYAILTWDWLAPADYQQLLAFCNSGSAVVYSNNVSGQPGGTFSFTGLPTYTPGAYMQGANLLKPFTITITEA